MKKNNVHHIYQFCTYNYNFINPLIGTFLIPQTSAGIYPCMTSKGRSQSVVLDGDQSGAMPVRLPSTVLCVTGFRTWVLLVPYVHKWHAWLNQKWYQAVRRRHHKYLDITNHSDCQSIQEDLSKLESWKTEWQVAFIPAKYKLSRPQNLKREKTLHSLTIKLLWITLQLTKMRNTLVSKFQMI